MRIVSALLDAAAEAAPRDSEDRPSGGGACAGHAAPPPDPIRSIGVIAPYTAQVRESAVFRPIYRCCASNRSLVTTQGRRRRCCAVGTPLAGAAAAAGCVSGRGGACGCARGQGVWDAAARARGRFAPRLSGGKQTIGKEIVCECASAFCLCASLAFIDDIRRTPDRHPFARHSPLSTRHSPSPARRSSHPPLVVRCCPLIVHGDEVATVDGFQGREVDVAVLATTRANGAAQSPVSSRLDCCGYERRTVPPWSPRLPADSRCVC